MKTLVDTLNESLLDDEDVLFNKINKIYDIKELAKFFGKPSKNIEPEEMQIRIENLKIILEDKYKKVLQDRIKPFKYYINVIDNKIFDKKRGFNIILIQSFKDDDEIQYLIKNIQIFTPFGQNKYMIGHNFNQHAKYISSMYSNGYWYEIPRKLYDLFCGN